ncbi:MAG: cyclic nucleotide-binding domain-containing protein [Actinomycetota bacterium]
MASDPIKMLSRVPLFEELSRKDLQAIARSSKEVSFAAGRKIVEEGQAGVAFHLILEGSARVSVKGKTKATLKAGDYFGEISLIDKGPRSATVVAQGPVRTLTLASWNFLQIVDRTPTIGRKLLQGLCKRIRESERSLAH